MKLFGGFDVVKFPEEDILFVTHNTYIYYIYSYKYKWWQKYRNAGNDSITVENYQDVRREELMDVMGGNFPSDEADFIRLCNPAHINVWDMIKVLKKDYHSYMSDDTTGYAVQELLCESDIHHVSYYRIRDLFDQGDRAHLNNEQIQSQIYQLSLNLLGRDIYKKEIGIVDGHDPSSYFWIQPVRVIDYSDTHNFDNVAEMSSAEISIEEDDVDQYLTPFLFKYYDDNLEANKKRVAERYDEDGEGEISYIEGFEWYLTHNFYTFDSMTHIINDLWDTIDALSSGRETEYTRKLREKRGTSTNQLIYAKNLTKEQIDEYNANRPTVDDTPAELIIDFYRRLIYRLEFMMKVGTEKGYNLISVMGP